METVIKQLILPEKRRILVISDVHGHYNHLQRLLEKVRFTTDDILFIVGDIIEKGLESLKTLRYIMELSENHTVYPLMGNVDAGFILDFDDTSEESNRRFFDYVSVREKRWGSTFFSEACYELGIEISNPDDISQAKRTIEKHLSKELNFLRSLPTLIETQNFIFVHGGLPTNESIDFSEFQWLEFIKNDGFMDKGLCFEKYVVVGHWPVTLYNDKISQSNPVINVKQRIISIDGGCGIKETCQLNALIIPDVNSEEFSYDSYDDFKAGYAKSAQQGSEQESVESINIRWPDCHIEILEKGLEISIVKHIGSGKILKMPNSLIKLDGDIARCYEYTDYLLSVNVGDKLSVIMETPDGYFVKKNGINGWYKGELNFCR